MTNLTPTRRGRCAGMQDWRAQYRALQMTGEEAAAQIRDGDVLVFSPLTNWPREVDAALAAKLKAEGGHVEIDSHFAPKGSCLLAPECAEHVSYHSDFFGEERAWVGQGNIFFAPVNLGQTPAWLGGPPSPGDGPDLLAAG